MSATNDWPNIPPPHPIENSSNSPSNVKIIPGGQKNMTVFSGGGMPTVPDNTGDIKHGSRFQAGVSGNPKGRLKGSRNRFTETFMRTLVDDFAANGASALAALRSTNPEAYLRIVISLLPKSLILKYEESHGIDYENVTEEEFLQLLNDLQRQKFMQQAVEAVSK